MELLRLARNVGMHTLHMGSDQRFVRRSLHQWWSGISRLWFHRLRVGDSLHRRLAGGNGLHVRLASNKCLGTTPPD